MASVFMALQMARTREHIARTTFASEVADFTDERPLSDETVRRFIRERHRHEPDDAEVKAAKDFANVQVMNDTRPSFEMAFSISMQIAVSHMAPLFGELHWRVEVAEQPTLWTSDRPVMPWRPPTPRDRYEGVGYADADEVRMPLSPTAMLVMDRKASKSPARVTSNRFHGYNLDIAQQSYEFVVCQPGRTSRLDQLAMAPNRAPVRFNTGPGVSVDRDGRESPMGDVLHTWTPLRA